MIVLCPSCNTRYHHAGSRGPQIPTAQCTGCDETFPMLEVKRNYVLLPRRSRMTIGLDDPTLADKVYGALPDPVAGAAALKTPAVEPPGNLLVELPMALAPSGVGAGVGYYLAGQLGLDPVSLAALGGAAGLLLGWACLLWMRPEN